MKTVNFVLITLFSIVSFAQNETTSYWVTKDTSSAFLIKTLSADTQFIATAYGSSEGKVTQTDSITKLTLNTPMKYENFPQRGQMQVFAVTTVTHIELIKVDGKTKIRELGSIQFPQNAELKTESLTEEYEVNLVAPQSVKLSLQSNDLLVLPSSGYEVFRARLSNIYNGVGSVLAANDNPKVGSSFLVSFDVTTTQRLSDGFDKMKVRLANGDSISYFGLNKASVLDTHYVYGIYTSKASKQVKVFTARIAKDLDYSLVSPNLLTKDLVSGKYYDELFDVYIEFKDSGVLVISNKSDGKVILTQAWKVEGSHIEAIRYVKENSGFAFLSEPELLACIEKPSTCSIIQSRTFLPLKIEESGMSVMRTIFRHRNLSDQDSKEVMTINLQVLKKVD